MMAHIVEETESHMSGDFYEKRTVSDVTATIFPMQ